MDNSRAKALFFRHRAALYPAVCAAMARGCWSQYAGLPARRICGASAAREGEAALADPAFIADRRAIAHPGGRSGNGHL